ncbi:hypothetical protein ASPCAL04697 [Aspergillus calidoustus]|uniref:Uncharacterized protein n=1 Tax=Aspergillus calidoustus TaxID=454130 RepID=A0A0U5FXR9_ASPCI|nr:hypothetical protein ASPCAL04697 [Aspergillus calidoustus]
MSSDFVFIHVRKPKDALKLAKSSRVRSHVTRQQWKQLDQRARRANANAVGKVLDEFENQEDSTVAKDKSDDRRNKLELVRLAPEIEFGIQNGAINIPRPLGGLRGDPFRSYPVAWRPSLPRFVDHYLMSMAVDIPELDQPGNRGLLRTSWFPLVMSERALFLVIILLAASNYASVQSQPLDMKLDLLALRCEAVQAVNEALEVQFQQHQPSCISDALVGAIAKMASYEAMYGDVGNYAVHMRGLERVIELRGGLLELGLSGLLRRIVIWIDRNGAFLNGSALHFPGETFAPGQPLPGPNPGHFLGAR